MIRPIIFNLYYLAAFLTGAFFAGVLFFAGRMFFIASSTSLPILSNLPNAGSLGFADGGEPPINQASWVGERGPELFVPKTAGTIIPNHQLKDVMGNSSSGPVFNGPYIANMSAIDTQSATQFLASNKNTIWAAYQSANRSVPISR